MADIVLRRVVKRFGDLEVVHGVDLDIADREFVVLVGPSGCGKSTLLRMIAGLETVSGGEIRIGGDLVNGIEPRHRDIAMVFQDYALYPHMAVAGNMSFGLRMRRFPGPEISERIAGAARALRIDRLLARRPGQLSGGQRQRVAMGRAIVRRPRAFLFDEPLSNLDAKLRVDMRTEIKRLHRSLETTMVYVTHDQVEAMTLADRIVVMRDGVVEQIGEPEDLYDRPANLFVAGFIGSPTMNVLPCRPDFGDGAPRVAVTDDLAVPVPPGAADAVAQAGDRPLMLGIRPEDMQKRDTDGPVIEAETQAEVVEPLGSDTLVHCRIGEHEVTARVPPHSIRRHGDRLRLAIPVAKLHLFDGETGRRLG